MAILIKEHNEDCFEGNAQSFRIITKLAFRRDGHPGLDLTRATLNATLKYPWHRNTRGRESKKWGAYHSEAEDFRWARDTEPFNLLGKRKSLEAQVMDFADDIAYAVRDAEDFFRGGLIPLDRFGRCEGEVDRFLDEVEQLWDDHGRTDLLDDKAAYFEAFKNLSRWFGQIQSPHTGSPVERAALRSMGSALIKEYIQGITPDHAGKLNPNETALALQIDEQLEREMFMLKQLTWVYVIRNPALASQQWGHRTIIRNLFAIYYASVLEGRQDLIPRWYDLQEAKNAKGKADLSARIAVDIVCLLTDAQAVQLNRRFSGSASGSIHDWALR